MSEAERRRSYSYPRVLISSERILAPEFDDAVVWLSGAQVEMLRNVTQYLNRIETYVEEEHPGYYLTPDTADFDDILAIVADLEETLMGNPNTIWGFSDTMVESEIKIGALPGNNALSCDACPAGKVWRVTNITAFNATSSNTRILLAAIVSGNTHYLTQWKTTVPPDAYNYPCDVILKEDDYIRAWFDGTTSMDDLYLLTIGYEMDVP